MSFYDQDRPHPPTPFGLASRRDVLRATGALAGISALSVFGGVSGSAPAQAATPPSDRPIAPNYHGKPPTPPPLIVLGGNLVDPATGDITEDAVVVLDRGMVTAIGSRDATRQAVAKLPTDTRTIDVGGRFILPGLIDAHVHPINLEGVRQVLHYGATSLRSGSSTFYQDVALAALPEWVPGASPRVAPAGLFVTPDLGESILADPGLAPLAGLDDGVRAPRDLAYLTRLNLARGATVIKTRANPRAGLPEQDPLELVYSREQLAAVVDAAGGAGVLCHAYSADGIDGAVRAGVRSIEHGVYVTESTLAEMARRDTAFTPTLATISAMADTSDPTLAERGRRFTPVLQQAVRNAAEAGVMIVAGTDSFGTSVIPIGREARMLADAGLSPLQALQSVTTNAARVLGQEHHVGRLARGAYADVTVVNTNPLASATALEQVSLVIAQGVVTRDEL